MKTILSRREFLRLTGVAAGAAALAACAPSQAPAPAAEAPGRRRAADCGGRSQPVPDGLEPHLPADTQEI